jgi:hypothetical protein
MFGNTDIIGNKDVNISLPNETQLQALQKPLM